MKKFRIIEVRQGDNVHYEIEQKGLFGFWSTIQNQECGIYVDCYYSPVEFLSKEEAETYIRNVLTPEVRTVVG